ncbi:MAG: hypothetical protein LBO67_01575 [Spirochaetaceae bacterium]|nr:hypothetical protein [Spirochaetaceae bacterium]
MLSLIISLIIEMKHYLLLPLSLTDMGITTVSEALKERYLPLQPHKQVSLNS